MREIRHTAPVDRAPRALLGKLVKPLLNERDSHVIWNQFSAVIDGLYFLTERRAAFDRRAKQFACRDRAQMQAGSHSARSAFLSGPLRPIKIT